MSMFQSICCETTDEHPSHPIHPNHFLKVVSVYSPLNHFDLFSWMPEHSGLHLHPHLIYSTIFINDLQWDSFDPSIRNKKNKKPISCASLWFMCPEQRLSQEVIHTWSMGMEKKIITEMNMVILVRWRQTNKRFKRRFWLSFNNSFPLPDGMQTRLSMGATLESRSNEQSSNTDSPFCIISIGKVLHVFEPQFPNRVPYRLYEVVTI